MTTVGEYRPLNLHLNAADLPPGPVRVEVVNGKGDKFWEGPATVQKDRIDVRVPRITASGNYFVRVFPPEMKAGAEDELLREFSINAK
jgi:hypothetical protein